MIVFDYKEEFKMKGYKVFNSDWTCRGYQYEIGKTYEIAESTKCCKVGFHFCEKLIDCFNYYSFDPNNKVAEIEAIGEIDFDDTNSKCCTNKIVILKELKWNEVLDMCNSGKGNSGHHNSGNYNSGNRNSGYHNSGNYNSGNYNSGYRNSGYRNSGYYNSGNCNSGYYNSGYRNSGYYNSGNCNSGYYNSGNCNSGYCNTNSPKVRMFNHETEFNFNDESIVRFKEILFDCPQSYEYSDFIDKSEMSEEEIIKHPECEIIGGYIKTIIVEADKQKWWDEDVSDDDKEFIKSLPYFDADIFYECVGVRV
jgi:hypothetical protein